jgi:tetratricopeptide (TPR) repeat protein
VVSRDQEQAGWQCLQEGRLEEAEGHFRRALELDPARVEALLGLGQVYLAWDELDEAAELFQMALSIAEPGLPRGRRRPNPNDPNVRPYLEGLGLLALTRVQRESYEDAVEALEEVLAWDPGGQDGQVYLWLGLCRQRLGLMDGARRCYEAARARHPEAWYLHGLVCLDLDRSDEARESFRTAARLWPEPLPLLAYYPRVRGLGRPGVDDRGAHAEAVRFVEHTIDLWNAAAQAVLRETTYPDAVGSP